MEQVELVDTGNAGAQAQAESVLERFISARLVTVDAGTVQISHESLLGAWPRLGEWVDSDREWLALRQQMSDAAQA